MHRIKDLKKCLLGWAECEVKEGMQGANLEALGEVIDMVKDLAETEEKCMKAAYYSTIMEGMQGAEDHAHRMGYDHWRYASTGEFAPKGHGTYQGYRPMMTEEEWRGRYPYGYSDDRIKIAGTYRSGGDRDHVYGYNNMRPMYDWSEKGMFYDDWKDAKRHYHESGKKEDLLKMNQKMGDNLANIIEQLREMSEEAAPELRKELKSEIAILMEDISKMT